MSNRPRATPSHPGGTSTGANGAKSVEGRLARCERYSLSPFPRKSKKQKRNDRAMKGRKSK